MQAHQQGGSSNCVVDRSATSASKSPAIPSSNEVTTMMNAVLRTTGERQLVEPLF